MGKINVLDKHIAELIAAGEVVERPSSVIKELVENSIDAGATNITIEIKHGGITYMRLTDNGCGIETDDVKKAFLRNATSKIHLEDDLNNISTLGFRGEALSSICAVAKVELVSRTKKQSLGSHYIIEGGEEVFFDQEYGCPEGTTIIVKDLFYNTPARMKFLKKDSSEANSISKVLDRMALSHPEVSFKFIKDTKQELNTPGNGKVSAAIYSVYGKEFFNSLIELDYSLNGIKLSGFISKPNLSKATRNMQHFFINGRYVKSRTAMVALEEAFKGSIMVQKFPACVMYIDIPYDMVDVNVHPSKVEVRFINERPIFDVVYHGVKTALIKGDKSALFLEEDISKEVKTHNLKKYQDKAINSDEAFSSTSLQDSSKDKTESKEGAQIYIPKKSENIYAKNFKASSFDISTETILKMNKDKGLLSVTDLTEPEMPLISKEKMPNDSVGKNLSNEKISNTPQNKESSTKSIPITPEDNNLYDEPVFLKKEDPDLSKPLETIKASEHDFRVSSGVQMEMLPSDEPNFKIKGEIFNTYIFVEKNSKELVLIDKHAAHERMIYEKLISKKSKPVSQLFLEPIVLSLSKDEYGAIIDNLDLFLSEGFDIEDFGSGAVIVRSAPSYLENADVKGIVEQMAEHILENKKNIASNYVEWLYENIACRAAIKAGKEAKPEEMKELIKEILKENPKYCPHGRPIAITVKKRDIEKRFGRA